MALWQEGKKAQRIQMLKVALKDKEPRTYRELVRDGDLDEYLDLHENSLMTEFNVVREQIRQKVAESNLSHMEKMQRENTQVMTAWEVAVEHHMEFPTSD